MSGAGWRLSSGKMTDPETRRTNNTLARAPDLKKEKKKPAWDGTVAKLQIFTFDKVSISLDFNFMPKYWAEACNVSLSVDVSLGAAAGRFLRLR